MFTFPAALTIRVLDRRSGRVLPQIALIVTLFASKKADYHIARVTDIKGEARLTIEEVRDSINRDQGLFIMDYASSLEECLDEIQIEICDTEQIKRTTAAMEMYRDIIDIDEDLIEGFTNSMNDRYAVPVFHRAKINDSVSSVQVWITEKEKAGGGVEGVR